MAPALVTRCGVPIAQVGTWNASTGVWNCTPEQLADAVAAQQDPAFRAGVLKLGHTDPRFNGDGQPALGRVVNLRLSPDGNTLLADLEGIPAWLDEVLATAYPSRSIEALLDVQSPSGRVYAMVVTGLALLGVAPPAIESLGDIADLFEQNREISAWVSARSVAATATDDQPQTGEGMPTVDSGTRRVVASATIEELLDAFEDWAATQDTLGRDCWVRDVMTDALIAVVWDGDDTDLYRVTWTETSDGVFAFGEPVEVRVAYQPVPATTTAASGGGLRHWSVMPLRYVRGREAVAAAALPEENHVPLSPAVAERLGLSEDADDAAILAALDAMKTAQTAPAARGPEDEEGDDAGGDAGESAPDDVPADLARFVEPIAARLATVSKELADLKAEKRAEAKEKVLAAAIADGKIRPADRDTYSAQYDVAPAVVTTILASIAPGTAIPVSATGTPGTDVDLSDDEAFWNRHFAGPLGLAGGVNGG